MTSKKSSARLRNEHRNISLRLDKIAPGAFIGLGHDLWDHSKIRKGTEGVIDRLRRRARKVRRELYSRGEGLFESMPWLR